jgi:hypothetical protein
VPRTSMAAKGRRRPDELSKTARRRASPDAADNVTRKDLQINVFLGAASDPGAPHGLTFLHLSISLPGITCAAVYFTSLEGDHAQKKRQVHQF